jgi:RNA polymerase sigma-19 factor, ECF subfamily
VNNKKPLTELGQTAPTRYKRELHRYLVRRLQNPQDVDDLAQEVYMRLMRVDEKKLIREPLAFLYGIAAHVVADFWIGAEREHRGAGAEPLDDCIDDESLTLPDDLAERLNLQQQLERAIAQLPPLHAAVLLAHKRDGLSYEEVAAKLRISVHTVEKYVTQAKARIRTMQWER